MINGGVLQHYRLEPTFCAGAILFASSRTVHAIQLADFAAFAMNRWQLLRVKERLSDLDKTLLEILTPIAECFLNIDIIRVDGFPSLNNLGQGMHRI
jgi:hypothetical protein